jgi:FKBP-type peptidyl-prolyl cis-trans isomerase 2
LEVSVVKYSHIILLGVFLLGAILISGCNADQDAAQAKNGDLVEVHYTGTLENGTVFDTSEGRDPLKFTLGAGQMISGFDQAVLGMKIGELKTVTIPADEAYGPYSDDLLIVINREDLPAGMDPYVGQQLQGPRPGGGTGIGIISNVTDTTITLDFNHRLAGEDLTFEIELMSIQ